MPSAAAREAPDAVEADGALISQSYAAQLSGILAQIGGSASTRIARALVLSEPLSMADGEVTAKGSVNFKRVLTRRAALLERLYDDKDVATVLVAKLTSPT